MEEFLADYVLKTSLAEDRAMAFDCGTDQYLTKPFDLRELLTRIRNRLERSQLLRSLSESDPLTGIANRRRALEMAERLLALAPEVTSDASFAVSFPNGSFSISAGAAVFPHDGDTYESLLAKADSRMYRDKSVRKRDVHRQLQAGAEPPVPETTYKATPV